MTPDEKHARFAADWSPARNASLFHDRSDETEMDGRGPRGW